jgi:hypothetical protein
VRSLLVAVIVLAACSRHEPEPVASEPTSTSVVFVDTPFEALYPVFLVRRTMSQGDKARLWNAYRDRWVRWEGVITSFTPGGVTLKVLLQTPTFDVSLAIEASSLAPVRQRFAVGDRVRFVGQLETFDDLFFKIYVGHGVLLAKLPQGDLGVPSDLSR